MRKRILSTLLIFLLAFSTLSGCSSADTESSTNSESSKDTGKVLTIGQGAEPITLNPDGIPDSNNDYFAQNVFNRLVKTNCKQEIVNDLAKDYTVSDDGLTYTFTLQDGVKFHDGEPLTSEDVKFTFEEILKQGGRASGNFGSIASIDCPDDSTVVFTLSNNDVTFLSNLASEGTYILPKHVYEGKDWMGDDAMQEPVGTGPFKYDSWDKGVKLTLTKNEDYYLGPDVPYLDKVVLTYISDANTALQAFENGELDVLGVNVSSAQLETLLDNKEIAMYKIMYPSRFFVSFNMTKEPFNNLQVRKAIAEAINSEQLVSMAIKEIGQVTDSYISPVYNWALNEDAKVPAYDLDQAKKDLAASGVSFADSYTLCIPNYSPFPEIGQVFQEQMKELGIQIEINMMEYAAYDEQVNQNKDFDLAITGENQGPEVSGISKIIASDGYLNSMGYSNPKVDELLQQGTSLISEEDRKPIYQEIQSILAEDIPFVPFSEWIGFYPAKTYVTGFPESDEVADKTGYGELTYTSIDQ